MRFSNSSHKFNSIELIPSPLRFTSLHFISPRNPPYNPRNTPRTPKHIPRKPHSRQEHSGPSPNPALQIKSNEMK